MLSLQNTIYNNWRTETKRGESFNGISRVGKYTNISEQYGWTLTSIDSHAADFTSSNVYTEALKVTLDTKKTTMISLTS